jgi:hypothetical protein
MFTREHNRPAFRRFIMSNEAAIILEYLGRFMAMVEYAEDCVKEEVIHFVQSKEFDTEEGSKELRGAICRFIEST